MEGGSGGFVGLYVSGVGGGLEGGIGDFAELDCVDGELDTMDPESSCTAVLRTAPPASMTPGAVLSTGVSHSSPLIASVSSSPWGLHGAQNKC